MEGTNEEQLEIEIEQADLIREKINLAVISTDEELETTAVPTKKDSPWCKLEQAPHCLSVSVRERITQLWGLWRASDGLPILLMFWSFTLSTTTKPSRGDR